MELRARAAFSASLAAAVLAGCAEDEKAAPAKPAPSVRVERVIDGDTVVLTRFGKTRLIGVNTPEEGRCGESAATRFTRRRLENKRVKYELGEERTDRYDRTLAYLTRGDTMHNLALVEQGYATVLTISPNDKYADRFEAAEEEAKEQEEGPLATCEHKRRQALAEKRARARDRTERRRAARLARRVGAAERRRRAAERRADRRRRGGYSGASIPKNCSGVSGSIPTPPSDPTNLDGDNDGEACE